MNLQVATSLDDFDPQAWNRLAGDDPFLQYAFLHALHETGCACPDTGWTPQYLLLNTGDVTRLGSVLRVNPPIRCPARASCSCRLSRSIFACAPRFSSCSRTALTSSSRMISRSEGDAGTRWRADG